MGVTPGKRLMEFPELDVGAAGYRRTIARTEVAQNAMESGRHAALSRLGPPFCSQTGRDQLDAACSRPGLPTEENGEAPMSAVLQRQKDRPEANGTWPGQWVHD